MSSSREGLPPIGAEIDTSEAHYRILAYPPGLFAEIEVLWVRSSKKRSNLRIGQRISISYAELEKYMQRISNYGSSRHPTPEGGGLSEPIRF